MHVPHRADARTHARAVGRLLARTAPALVVPFALSLVLLAWHAARVRLDPTWLLVCFSPAIVFCALFLPLAYPHVLAEVDESYAREGDYDPDEWRFDADRF
jgi:hypothetical protein